MKKLRKEMSLVATSLPITTEEETTKLILDNPLSEGVYLVETDGTDDTGSIIGNIIYVKFDSSNNAIMLNFPVINYTDDAIITANCIYENSTKFITPLGDSFGGFGIDCITRFYKIDL